VYQTHARRTARITHARALSGPVPSCALSARPAQRRRCHSGYLHCGSAWPRRSAQPLALWRLQARPCQPELARPGGFSGRLAPARGLVRGHGRRSSPPGGAAAPGAPESPDADVHAGARAAPAAGPGSGRGMMPPAPTGRTVGPAQGLLLVAAAKPPHYHQRRGHR
jgi:hypothetical protein